MPEPAAPRDIEAEVRAYFEVYAERFNEALRSGGPTRAIADLYTDGFLAAHPEGVDLGQNGRDFEDALEQGFQYYRIIGTQGMAIRAVDVTSIDDFHAMARVHWRASYTRTSDNMPVDIDFDVVYLVQNLTPEKPTAWRVFVYITGDEQAEYEKHGLT